MASETQNWNVKVDAEVLDSGYRFRHNYNLTGSETDVLSSLNSMQKTINPFHKMELKNGVLSELFELYMCMKNNKLEEYQGEFVQIRKV